MASRSAPYFLEWECERRARSYPLSRTMNSRNSATRHSREWCRGRGPNFQAFGERCERQITADESRRGPRREAIDKEGAARVTVAAPDVGDDDAREDRVSLVLVGPDRDYRPGPVVVTRIDLDRVAHADVSARQRTHFRSDRSVAAGAHVDQVQMTPRNAIRRRYERDHVRRRAQPVGGAVGESRRLPEGAD